MSLDMLGGGHGGGNVGLCGQDSRHFWAGPIVAWVTRHARPEITVQLVVENAGSTQERFIQAFLECCGVPRQNHLAPHIDTSCFSQTTRDRIFVSAMP